MFRKNALERLTSPEQIDRLLTIVHVPGWIALGCMIALVLILFFWSIFGTIPVTANGIGIFFNPEDIRAISTDHIGVVEAIHVQTGQKVKKGDELITLHNFSLTQQYEELKNKVALAESELVNENMSLDRKKGELSQLQDQLKFIQAHLSHLILRAPEDGIVLEVNAVLGKSVDAGTTLIWFERALVPGDENLVYSFFPVDQGAQIKVGMKVFIEFSAVNKDLYGKMVGKVKAVLPFAVSKKGEILQSIPSIELRDFLTQNSVSTIVEVEPVANSATVSGYQWTTPHGPPFTIPRGSLSSITVQLAEKRPISYLLPL